MSALWSPEFACVLRKGTTSRESFDATKYKHFFKKGTTLSKRCKIFHLHAICSISELKSQWRLDGFYRFLDRFQWFFDGVCRYLRWFSWYWIIWAMGFLVYGALFCWTMTHFCSSCLPVELMHCYLRLYIYFEILSCATTLTLLNTNQLM